MAPETVPEFVTSSPKLTPFVDPRHDLRPDADSEAISQGPG